MIPFPLFATITLLALCTMGMMEYYRRQMEQRLANLHQRNRESYAFTRQQQEQILHLQQENTRLEGLLYQAEKDIAALSFERARLTIKLPKEVV